MATSFWLAALKKLFFCSDCLQATTPIEHFETIDGGTADNRRFADPFARQRSNSARDKPFLKLRQKIERINCQSGSQTLGRPVSLLADAWSLRSFSLGYRISRLCSSFGSIRREADHLQAARENIALFGLKIIFSKLTSADKALGCQPKSVWQTETESLFQHVP
ncbi:MAG: hypothetical protein ACREQ2_21985 [Candidatus Binatia bacterium]